MPELPEVETVRKGLDRYLKGQTITGVTIRRAGLRFPFPVDFVAQLTGTTVLNIDRRAKYLLIRLSRQKTLLSHLGMSGSFFFADSHGHPPSKHDHVLFKLSNGSTMVYNDPRRFGIMDILRTGTEPEHKLLHHLGPEPLNDDWNARVFCEAIRNRGSSIKTTLLNQEVVVGVGNIYACEALFNSKISPRRLARSVGGNKRATLRSKRLVGAVKEVLGTAIEAGGSTLKDFQDVEGNAGYFAHQFKVYGREGQDCVREECNGVVKRIVQGGRSTFFCPTCQR